MVESHGLPDDEVLKEELAKRTPEGRAWDVTKTGWKCTCCGYMVIGYIDAQIDEGHVCHPGTPEPKPKSDVPVEAVQEGGAAIVDMLDGDLGRAEWLAELAIARALPLLAEHWATRIEAERGEQAEVSRRGRSEYTSGHLGGMERAAALVRGLGSVDATNKGDGE